MLGRFVAQAANKVVQGPARSFHGTPAAAAHGYKMPSEGIVARASDPYASRTAAIRNFLYTNFVQKASSSALMVAGLAVVFEQAYENVMESAWKSSNANMQYEDVIATFPEVPPNCDE